MLWIAVVVIVVGALALTFGAGGTKGSGLGAKFIRFVVNSGSNVVPILYTVAIAFFLRQFDVYCLPLVKSGIHRVIIRISYTAPFASMARLYFSDPGRITRANHDRVEAAFAYDRILFMPHKECWTCEFSKPARSGHCSSCGFCIAMKDHHCVWANNCIGLGNARWFLLFLVAHVYFFGYGLILTTWMLWSAVNAQLSVVFTTWQSYIIPKSWWNLSWRIIGLGMTYRISFCCWILCVALVLISALFLGYQLRFIYQGVTANEADKWGDIAALMAMGELYVYTNPKGSILLQRFEDGGWNRSLTPAEDTWVHASRATLVQARDWSQLTNIYDKGFSNNLRLVLVPPDVL